MKMVITVALGFLLVNAGMKSGFNLGITLALRITGLSSGRYLELRYGNSKDLVYYWIADAKGS